MKLTAELRQYKANKENSVPNKSSRKVAKVAETSTARAVKSSSTRNDISMKPAVKVENEIVVKKVSKPTGTVPKTATGGAIPKISSQKSKEARITLIDRTKMIGELAKLTAKASASCTSSTSSSSSSINSYNSKESRFIH